MLASVPVFGETWYIRPDGGTRYSAKVPTGQCDGKADLAYHGGRVNQHCAFNDFRFMWDDQSYQSYAWVMTGGDTVIIEGCAANANQPTPSAPDCRIGWDAPWAGQTHFWCFGGSGNAGCSSPPIPAGSAAQHTRILGKNYASCSTGSSTDRSKLTQIFGGYGVGTVLNLGSTRYVDIQCLEITSHNGKCIVHGSPAYPKACTTDGHGLSDFDGNGIVTNNATANITLQDVSIHGHTTSGIQGPIGGAITMNRVFIGFNGFAGWNFDDGHPTPDAPGSSITANYVTMEANGCNEEYPISHAFPAMSCYDLNSGGFGDAWSGQQTNLESFTCNHCQMLYNTKDGFIGPHTDIKHLLIENSESIGNMGQQWKWVSQPNSSTVFVNNLTVGNCSRLSEPFPGALPTYNKYLSLFCRASGDIFSFSGAANSTVLIANNTTVGYSATVFDLNCLVTGTCGSTHYVFRNNIIAGYLNQKYNAGNANVPNLFYISDSSDSVTADHNIYYNLRSRCLLTGNLCSDPQFMNEPAKSMTSEAQLDGFNFRIRRGSPAAGGGVVIGEVSNDFFGTKRSAPPSIGAVEP
jgi:hypothetical protein